MLIFGELPCYYGLDVCAVFMPSKVSKRAKQQRPAINTKLKLIAELRDAFHTIAVKSHRFRPASVSVGSARGQIQCRPTSGLHKTAIYLICSKWFSTFCYAYISRGYFSILYSHYRVLHSTFECTVATVYYCTFKYS